MNTTELEYMLENMIYIIITPQREFILQKQAKSRHIVTDENVFFLRNCTLLCADINTLSVLVK